MKLSDYTFETFIDIPSNHLARLAAQKICESPGVYNPLYIFGPSGTGKPFCCTAPQSCQLPLHSRGF